MDGLIIGFRPHGENVITTYLHVHVTIMGFGVTVTTLISNIYNVGESN